MEVFGYVMLIAVGLLLGMMGGGGSILSVPILVYLFSLDVVMASAYSLFIVGSTSLVGTVLRWKQQLVNMEAALRLGIPSLLGAFITRKWIVCEIPSVVLQLGSIELTKRVLVMTVFALLLMVSALLIIRKKSPPNPPAKRVYSYRVTFVGFIIGFLSGFAGVGGGFLILPALLVFVSLPFGEAVGTALLLIAINSLAGFAGDLINHTVNWIFLLSITSLAIAGIIIGNTVSGKTSVDQLRKSFGWLSLVLGTWILLREWLF